MEIPNVSFTSLGLVVLDEIRIPCRESLTNVVGGSGAYGTLGARLFLRPPRSLCLGWPIHIGNDFPETVKEYLESWDTTLIIEKELDRPSTRGLLEYKDTKFGTKEFKYTTPVLTVQDSSIESTGLLKSKAFHYLHTPQEIKLRITGLLDMRQRSGVLERPLIIWEPAPPSCKPENLRACLEAAALVDVFSPNHLELAAFFGKSLSASQDKHVIEQLVLRFIDSGVGRDGRGTVIVRAGEHGCVIGSRDLPPRWLPPFYDSTSGKQHVKVVDPTGAGNAFLGAYAVGYLETGSVVEAACYGSVGSTFALEQVGMPKRSKDGNEELWNGANVFSRLHEYMTRVDVMQGLLEVSGQSSWRFSLKLLRGWLTGFWFKTR